MTDDAARAWAVVLAGGEGVRLRSVTRAIVGDDRPKQYVPLIRADSLLRQTMARAARLTPGERTVVVSQQRHAGCLAADLGFHREPKLLLQPENRDAAAGVLLPVYWIAARDPDATVVVYPSDHFVLEEAAFVAHVVEVVAFVDRQCDGIVLLGARATEPDTEYGWIEPGEAVGATTSGSICRVAGFREKPTPPDAAMCLARKWLWNTFVMVSKASTLVSVADVLLPELHGRLTAVTPFLDTRREAEALEQAYASLPRHNFSETVLQAGLPFLAVSALPPLTWSDLGTPQRLLKVLRALGLSAAWMRGRRPGVEAPCELGERRERGLNCPAREPRTTREALPHRHAEPVPVLQQRARSKPMKILGTLVVALALVLSTQTAQAHIVQFVTAVPMTAVAGVQEEAAMSAIIMTAVKHALREAVAFASTLVLVEDARVVGGHIYLRVLAADSEGEAVIHELQNARATVERGDVM